MPARREALEVTPECRRKSNRRRLLRKRGRWTIGVEEADTWHGSRISGAAMS
jgi:hypothetical protein